jgi:hypothetical protein
MVSILSEEKLYKTSFSKYGTAYTQLVIPEMAEAAAASVLQRQAAGETEAEAAEKRSPHTAPEVRKEHSGSACFRTGQDLCRLQARQPDQETDHFPYFSLEETHRITDKQYAVCFHLRRKRI